MRLALLPSYSDVNKCLDDDGLSSDSGAEEWFCDDLYVCGALNRAHKSHCPLNSRNKPNLALSLGGKMSQT